MSTPWQVVASVPTAEGRLELRRRNPHEVLITIGGRVLMTSVARRSEEALGTLACAQLRGPRAKAPQILLGGLGMGFTLRSMLDVLPSAGRVVVAELNACVIDWCRGPLSELTAG